MKISKKIILFALVVLFLGLSFGRISSTALTPLFQVSVSPELPTAGDRVTVSVLPLNFSATSTSFTWYHDGIQLISESGTGRNNLVFGTDPKTNEAMTIRVVVGKTPDFVPAEETVTIYTLPNARRQEEVLTSIANDFTLRVSNSSPNPGETVNFEVISYAFDRNNVSYEWRVNGVIQRESSGRGRFSLAVPAGKDGERKTVSVSVVTMGGEALVKRATIQSTHVALYWWADTAIPYWYKGKALPSRNAQVTVFAFPNNRNSSSLNFQWSFNDAINAQSSGIGKQVFTFPLNFTVNESIEVQVSDVSGALNKKKAIDIEPREPIARIYETRVLRGAVYEKTIKTADAVSGETETFVAFPFYFTPGKPATLSYSWLFNGETISGTFTKPWLFVLKSNPGEFSQNTLAVDVADPVKNGVRTSSSIQVNFR